jgi:anaerobic magnesium-protoporphyrin IX monomethyl ester cyclase
MRVALVNPRWSFEGSIYFGCREPHLPLEFGYAKALLEAAGHDALIVDGHLHDLDAEVLAAGVAEFDPDMIVVTTAPSYLFWRCAQPELRVPRLVLDRLRPLGARLVAVGPHGSTTPRAVLRKLGVDVVVMGECEEVLLRLSTVPLAAVDSICWRDGDQERVRGGPAAASFVDRPALIWPTSWLARHAHHHHRFEALPDGPGAEVETSRGCPYHCSFCAKENFRDRYRRRRLPAVLEEIDRLIAAGVTYVYFIDEIFLPNRPLLEALVQRDVRFGVQTRIDLWKPDMIKLLGRAGCVSIEAGVESITAEGRAWLEKDCRVSTDELRQRLILARNHVPFVQANMIMVDADREDQVRSWCDEIRTHGVWTNEPVPLFPYPGSPDYRRIFGLPDDDAWERAHDHYLSRFRSFSDLQEARPASLADLELACSC